MLLNSSYWVLPHWRRSQLNDDFISFVIGWKAGAKYTLVVRWKLYWPEHCRRTTMDRASFWRVNSGTTNVLSWVFSARRFNLKTSSMNFFVIYWFVFCLSLQTSRRIAWWLTIWIWIWIRRWRRTDDICILKWFRRRQWAIKFPVLRQ